MWVCNFRITLPKHAYVRWQVRFYYSFASRENLYIVMEYLGGGDCFSLLRSVGALEVSIVCDTSASISTSKRAAFGGSVQSLML